MRKYIQSQLQDNINIISQIMSNDTLLEQLTQAACACIEAFKNNKKIMLAGNGGSSADAQHIVGEFVSRFVFDRPGLAAIALTTNTSILTAIGNDYGFEKIFSRQIQAIAQNCDVLIVYSTSGRSKNIIDALLEAKSIGVTPVLVWLEIVEAP